MKPFAPKTPMTSVLVMSKPMILLLDVLFRCAELMVHAGTESKASDGFRAKPSCRFCGFADCR